MGCVRPLHGYVGRVRNPSGKRSVVFNVAEGFKDRPVTVPCGQCIGCRLEYSRQWAVRCMHEASCHEENVFITLTYDDAHLPAFGSLDRGAFPRFMKRLRKANDGKRVRYFHCGEYGDRSGRPHYHALLFGHDFSDKVPWSSRGDHVVYRSPELERLWPFGLSEIGSVSFESAAYVARYVTKKVTGDEEMVAAHYSDVDGATGELVKKVVEYCTMSRRPGIGAGWLEKFGDEVYPSDGVVVNGKLVRPPRYYDEWLKRRDERGLARVRGKRRRSVVESECEPERLEAKRKCMEARVNLHGRM